MYLSWKCIFECAMFFYMQRNIQSIIQMKNSFCAPVLCLTTGLNKFYHTNAQIGIPCIKYVQEELSKTNTQNSQPTQVLKYFKGTAALMISMVYQIEIFEPWPWYKFHQNRLKNGEVMGNRKSIWPTFKCTLWMVSHLDLAKIFLFKIIYWLISSPF